MKQSFSKDQHLLFQNYFHMKEYETNIEQEFYKKTYSYIQYIKWIPGLKMVGIGNSIAMNSASCNSDIDLLIVSSPQRMWLVRILVTLIFQLLGVRKTGTKHAGRFCLSFFATTDGLNFGDFVLENDIYLYFWILYFKPLLNYDNTYQLFLTQNENWADFSEYQDLLNTNKQYIRYEQKSGTKEGRFFTFVNNLLKRCALPKTLRHYEKIGKPYGIIINDNLLKFHNGDIRKKISDELL